MSKPASRMVSILVLILGVVTVLVATGMAVLYYSGDRSPDPLLAENVQNEYSVPVEVRIISTPEGNVPYIVPGKVKWDPEHKSLLYNLSNPKEATLAIVETIANRDEQALDILMSQSYKDYWARKGYSNEQIMEKLRLNYGDVNKPYIFGLDPAEAAESEDVLPIQLKWDSGEMEFPLARQSDGTWRL